MAYFTNFTLKVLYSQLEKDSRKTGRETGRRLSGYCTQSGFHSFEEKIQRYLNFVLQTNDKANL